MKTLTLLLFCLFPVLGHAKLNVVASTSDLAALAREITGDLAEVTSLARGYQDPHFLEAKPSFVVQLNKADLLIDVGLDLEIGWLPVIVDQARNPKIYHGQPGRLTAADGVNILEIPHGKIDRSMGDVHPEGNPHYWLDPRNGVAIARNIMERLKVLDPVNASAYQQNFDRFWHAFKPKMDQWLSQAKLLRGKKVISHHRSFTYLFQWLGIEVAEYIEPKPGIPPPPAHLLKLEDILKSGTVKMIIAENYYDPKPSRELGKKAGIPVLHLASSVGGDKQTGTYSELFDSLISQMAGAL